MMNVTPTDVPVLQFEKLSSLIAMDGMCVVGYSWLLLHANVVVMTLAMTSHPQCLWFTYGMSCFHSRQIVKFLDKTPVLFSCYK